MQFQVGQRVQALWKGEWEHAIIRKVDQNGKFVVQFDDDEDDDLTHLDRKKLKHECSSSSSSSSSESSSDEEDGGSHRGKKSDKHNLGAASSLQVAEEKSAIAAQPSDSVAALAAFQSIRVCLLAQCLKFSWNRLFY
jgi:archaellum component FlaD/FlaE